MPKKALAVYRSLDSPEWFPLWFSGVVVLCFRSGPKARRILILKLLPWQRAQQTLRKASAGGEALITSAEVLEWAVGEKEVEMEGNSCSHNN
ncbi:hypothetical protein ACLKA7_009196 [Drosophila subpalustris]